MGLHVFQYETWPEDTHEQLENEASIPESTTSQPLTKKNLSLGEHFANTKDSEEGSTDDVDLESTMGDFSKAPQDDDLRPFDDVSATTATTTATQSTAATASKPLDEANLSVHESVTTAIAAYILVMEHKHKTNFACEQALECVTQLVVRDYVAGTANAGKEGEEEPSLLHRLMEAIQRCSESNTDTVQSQVVKCTKEVLISPKCAIHEASLLLAIRSIFHIYLVTKSDPVQHASKAALMEMLQSMIFRMEDQYMMHKARNPSTEYHHSLDQMDVHIVLRSLVKLSSKVLPGIDDNSTTPTNFLAQQFLTTKTVDPLALHNKVLSLELILQMMECAGDAFCNGEKFIHLVQSQLCVSLLKNCMSNNTQVSFVSQKK